MDAELRQERIYSQLLEVDNEALTMKVAKYRNIILAAFTGEDNSGVTQPASRVVHAARSAVARPTLPVATVCCPNLYRGCVLMLTWMAPSDHRVRRC